MFHNFYAGSQPPSPPNFQDASLTMQAAAATPRRARRTAFKACDRCRSLRIKCGAKPCTKCVEKGVQCCVSDDQDYNRRATNENQTSISSSSSNPKTSPKPSPVNTPPVNTPVNQCTNPLSTAVELEQFFWSSYPTFSASESLPGPFPGLPLAGMPSGTGSIVDDVDQRCCFLRVFWSHCQPQFPVISADEFRELYDYESRGAIISHMADGLKSATADCMIALGMQHAQFTGTWHQIMDLPCLETREELAWPGIVHFRRAQETLRKLTTRCLDTLRCYGLLALYLRKAGDVEGAYNLTGIGLRRAMMANLNRDPSSDASLQTRLTRARTWWLLYSLDTFCSVQLGVFMSTQNAKPSMSIPVLSPQMRAPLSSEEENEVAFLSQVAKLASATADMTSSLPPMPVSMDQEQPDMLEKRALIVSRALRHLDTWRRELPPAFSSRYCDLFIEQGDRASLALADLGSSPGLQRQRLLLALQYHSIFLCVQRPFLCCCPPGAKETQQSTVETLAQNGIEHAMAIIHTIHAICATSDALYGWCEILQPLWDATVTTVAYVHLHPFGHLSLMASRSITMARALFELFAQVSPVAAEAQGVIEAQVNRMALVFGGGSGSTALSVMGDSDPATAAAVNAELYDGSVPFALPNWLNATMELDMITMENVGAETVGAFHHHQS